MRLAGWTAARAAAPPPTALAPATPPVIASAAAAEISASLSHLQQEELRQPVTSGESRKLGYSMKTDPEENQRLQEVVVQRSAAPQEHVEVVVETFVCRRCPKAAPLLQPRGARLFQGREGLRDKAVVRWAALVDVHQEVVDSLQSPHHVVGGGLKKALPLWTFLIPPLLMLHGRRKPFPHLRRQWVDAPNARSVRAAIGVSRYGSKKYRQKTELCHNKK